MQIDKTSGAISGTVAAGDMDYSVYHVTVAATDVTSGASASRWFTWNVNSPITITAPPAQTDTEGDSVSLSNSASDSSGGTLTYGAVGLPAGLSINYSTGAISGTVSAGDAADGPYTVTLLAEDGTYRNTTQLTWDVNGAITLTPPTDQTNSEGDSVSVTVSASYSGGGLTYSATGLPNGLSINSSTGVISGTASYGGSFDPTVTASHSSVSTSVTFDWTVSDPITITDPGPQQYNAGDAVSLPISASDTAAGTLGYSALGLPTGLSINSSTGLISGTISGSLGVGVYTSTVTVTDGTNTGVDSFAWTISAAGAVVVTDPGTQTTTEGSSVSLTVGKSYSGSGTVAYSAEGLPPGLAINPSTGVITGTVPAGDSLFGPYDVTVTITDGTATDSQYFVWNISSPISLTNPGTQSSTEGGSVSLSISASYSGGSLTYSADGLPAGLKINPSTGAITGTVAAGDAADGPYEVTVQAAHGAYAAEQTFTWNVASPITISTIADQTNDEGDSPSLSLSASDSVSGSTLKYSALGLPPGLKINASSGAITGTAAAGDAAGGPYSVSVIAEDGTYSALQTFNWIINSPVTITTPADQTNNEGDSVSLSISASDSSGTLTYAAEGLPPGLVINPTTGAISGTVTAGDAANGPYFVTILAEDGTYSASTTFTWNVNSPVSINVPDDQTNNQGDSVTLSISVTNTAGGTLSWSASGLPNGLSINSSTGVISGTVSYGGSWEPAVTATNGTYSDTESFGWTVNSFVSIADPGDQLNQVGDAVSLTVTAADEASGTLSYSASGLPTGLSINSSTGAITGTVGTGASTSAPYTPTVTVSDGTNEAVDTFTWTINPSGSVSIPYVASQTNTAGDEVALPVSVNNTAGQTLFFTASGLPAGLYINPVTGLIFGTVSAGDSAGSPYSVTVTASSGSSTASQTFNWTVDAAATVTLANPGDQFGNEGATVSVSLSGADSSSGTPYYAAFGLPPGLKINTSTGAITGTVAVGDSAYGPYTVTVIANDGTYSASQTFAWNVSAPITITEQNDQTNNEGDSASLSISASDTSGTLTYAAEGLPPGLKINPSSGAITGTVAVQDAAGGPYFVTVIAEDGTYTNSTTLNWNVNSPITISVPDTQSNNDGDSVSLTVGAYDAPSAALTFGAQGLPPGLSINPSTGAITGTIAVGDSSIGSFFPTLLVTDGTYTAVAGFEWDIGGVISISVPSGLENVVGDALTLPIAASDSGGGTLSYAATGLPAGLSINTATGAITGTIASAAASVGNYTTTVTASDGTNTVSGTFDWAVSPAGTVTLATPSNQTTAEGASASLSLSGSGGTLHYFAEGLPPGIVINPSTGAITGTMAVGDSAYAPYTVTVIATNGSSAALETFTWGAAGVVTMTPIADQTSNEGASASLSISASDSSSGTLSYSAVGLPPGLSISASTGAIGGTVALDAAAAGPYTVTVTAGDGTYSASQAFTWTISSPVTITAVADQTNNESNSISLTIGASDSSGGTPEYSAVGLPAGLSINASTGVISGTVARGDAAEGMYGVTVSANDGTYSASTTFTWTINSPITITVPSEQEEFVVGESVAVQVRATDAISGSTLSYKAFGLPAGLTINAATGLISGTISNPLAALGSFEWTVAVTDGTYTQLLDPDITVLGLTLTSAAAFSSAPSVPEGPPDPDKFAPGDPDLNAKVGTSWLVKNQMPAGDVVWITRDQKRLDQYIFIKKTGTVVPAGACMWNDGYNVPFVVTDANGDLTTVVLFNLEPLDKDFKQSF